MIETPFTALSATASHALVEASSLCDLEAGDVVFREGDVGGSLFLVSSGLVAVEIGVDGAQPVTVALRGRGEMLGEMALFAKAARRSATSTARMRSRLLELDADACARVRAAHHELDDLFLRILAERSAALSRRLAERDAVTGDRRLASCLLGVPLEPEPRAAIPATARDIADLAGLDPSEAEIALGGLRDRGVITLDGGIEILDRPALSAMASLA